MRTFATIASLTAGALAAAFIVTASGSVRADDKNFAPIKDATVLKECGACHMAYLPSMLPAESWNAIMAGLKDHFGENADLDAETAKRIGDYLAANAADARNPRARTSQPSSQPSSQASPQVAMLRITETAWWKRKHEKRGRVAPETLKRKGAKLKSDCVACHADAARGLFDDD